MELAVEIRNLKKDFGDRTVVNDLSIEIPKGECFGFLGPNGAGKTTLLRMLCGSARPQSGELFILGASIKTSLREIKSRMGVVPQGEGLDPELTVRENLRVFASYFGIPKNEIKALAEELLIKVGLEDRGDDVVEILSGGLKRRLALIRCVINNPELLVLDEPTVGLDPQARFWVWDFLREQKQNGKTLIFTTHYLEEAEALCDRIGLLHKGQLLDVGTPAAIVQKHWGKEVVEFIVPKSETSYYANRLEERKLQYQLMGDRFLVALAEGQSGQDLLSFVKSAHFSIRKPNLNDVFLKMTGAELAFGEDT